MKSLFIIFAFVFITEIQPTWGHEESKSKAESKTNRFGKDEEADDLFKLIATIGENGIHNVEKRTLQDSRITSIDELQPRGLETNQQNSKESADKMRADATKARDDILEKAQLDYNQFEAGLRNKLQNAETKQQEEIQIAEEAKMIADILASATLRNAHQKWTNLLKNNEKEYQEAQSIVRDKKTKIMQIRDATLQAADEQLVRIYTAAEERRRRAGRENQEALVKCGDAYDNARKSAEQIKSQAEIELWNVAVNYDEIPLGPWTEISARYDAEMKRYERAVQEADKEKLIVLDKFGMGTEYKETLKKAVIELVNAYNKGESVALAEFESCDQQLRDAQKSREEVMKLVNNEIQNAEIKYRDATDRARAEAEKQYEISFKKWKRKQAMIKLLWKKGKEEFLKEQAALYRRFDETVKEASTIGSGTNKVAEGRRGINKRS